MFRLSRSNVNYIKPVFSYLSILGLTPFLNFHTGEITCKNLHRFLVFFFSLLTLFLHVKGIPQLTYDETLFNIMEAIFGVISFTLTFQRRYVWLFQCNLWERYFQKMILMETLVKLNSKDCCKVATWKSPLSQSLLLISWSYVAITFSLPLIIGKQLWLYYFYRATSYINNWTLMLICTEVLRSISYKYWQLNELILTVNGDYLEETKVNKIRKCRRLYHNMGEISGIVNDLFSGYFFMAFFYFGYKIIHVATLNYQLYRLGKGYFNTRSKIHTTFVAIVNLHDVVSLLMIKILFI